MVAAIVPSGALRLVPPPRLKSHAVPVSSIHRITLGLATVVLASLSLAPALAAQAAGSSLAILKPQYETRANLDSLAAAARREKRTSVAWLLDSRLQNGDFQEGDRIVVTLATTGRSDTVQVRSGKVLQFPGMSDLSLQGVLRSELTDTLRSHFARYLRYPEVRAVPLLPLAVLGAVRAPGYHYTAADAVLRDVVMSAGGPSPEAQLDKALVRRNGSTIWSSSDIRVAMADGLSVDRLHLRAGDEIYIPIQRRWDWTRVMPILSLAVTITTVVIQLQR
jgi:hypothetical protein